MFVLNILCVKLFVTSSVAAFEAATWIKSMYITKYRDWKTEKKKIWKSEKFSHKSPSNRWFRNGIHSL